MKLKHRFEYIFYLLFSSLARIFGFSHVHILGRFIGTLFFYIIPIRKKVVMKNLGIAFPGKSSTELKDIALANYISLAITFLEIALVYYSDKETIASMVDFCNLDNAKQQLQPNENGTILLTAHFGNWEIGALTFGIWLNRPISVLAKDQKNKFVSKRMRAIREKFGNREILLGVSVRELYKTLKEKGYIGVVGDQRAPKDSMRVDYFGQKTAVFPGTASLALKLRPPVFIALFRRMESGRYMIELEEISYDNLPDESEAAMAELTQRYMSNLEKYVRLYPEQWFWMHNIWKH